MVCLANIHAALKCAALSASGAASTQDLPGDLRSHSIRAPAAATEHEAAAVTHVSIAAVVRRQRGPQIARYRDSPSRFRLLIGLAQVLRRGTEGRSVVIKEVSATKGQRHRGTHHEPWFVGPDARLLDRLGLVQK
jgi:hypothetical protein